MTEEKLDQLLSLFQGMKSYEWTKLKQQVDMMYSSKAAKVELDDLELLEQNIRREFGCKVNITLGGKNFTGHLKK